jgi:hypothetical protein
VGRCQLTSFLAALREREREREGTSSYPKDDVSKVVSITPSLSERWLGITGAFLRLYIEGSIRIRRVGDGETVVG